MRPPSGDRAADVGAVRRRLLPLLLAIVSAASTGSAQAALAPGGPLPVVPGSENPHGPAAAGPRAVVGRVERLTREGPTPVPGVMVTLHRVGTDGEGPVDSTRTDRAGGYRLRYRASGNARAIYFAATTWNGIAYFTAPLRSATVTGNAARLTVYDTTSRGLPVVIRGRHIIVSAADSSRARAIIEVYELANDSVRTLVGADSSTPTLTLPVPMTAHALAVGQGDVPADAASSAPGILRVFAPFAPGLKQLSFSYTLADRDFPARFSLERAAEVLEVLVEDPSATISGAALQNAGPVAADGRTFKRFLGQHIAAGGDLTVAVPGSAASSTKAYIIGVVFAVGVALLGGLARTAFVGRGARASRVRMVDDDPERLAREIADLDRAHARRDGVGDADAADYARARTALKERLTLALARRDGDA